MDKKEIWLGLMIGNSRLHWGYFIGDTLNYAWNTNYLPPNLIQQLANYPSSPPAPLPPSPHPLHIASVVPSQTALWQDNLDVKLLTLDQVPLLGVYPTLGIDRALAVWAAGETWGFPVLVIDAGTALTFTGADDQRCLVGGAILPGLGLQLKMLSQKTALPQLPPSTVIPSRFAISTSEAIYSGVIYTLVAGIKDFVQAWWQDFPTGVVAITGGDRELLFTYLQSQEPEIAVRVIVESNLILWGMAKIVT